MLLDVEICEMNWKQRALGTAVIALILTSGCTDPQLIDDGGIDVVESTDSLHQELIRVLTEASDGEGPSYYMMPRALSEIPADPNNPITAEKVALGKLLYHETALGTDPQQAEGMFTYSCASCHHAQAGFQAGLPQGIGEGGMGFGLQGEGRIQDPGYSIPVLDIQPIRTPSVLNIAFQEAVLWNGQFGATGVNVGTEDSWYPGSAQATNYLGFEGTETQAIKGLDVHRMGMDAALFVEYGYGEQLISVFGDLGDTLMSDVYAGLAIAAYERTVLASEAPFQRWLRGDEHAMTKTQKEGAILFFGKANCASCHNGPSLANMEFHAIGMKELEGQGVHTTVFENQTVHLGRGGFTNRPEDMYKFKVPQLYNLKDSRFYGHGASFQTVLDVVRYKNEAVKEMADCPDIQLADEFVPLGLTEDEIWAITVFINDGLYDADLMRYVPESLPSGNCFPNNDGYSASDLGCD